MDHRNNVIYNWGFKSSYGGGRYGEINMVGNYTKPAPVRKNSRSIFDVSDDGTGRYYINGNHVVGHKDVTRDNRLGVGGKKPAQALVSAPYPYEPIREDSPRKAYKRVLANVGCSHARDSYDSSILKQVIVERLSTATKDSSTHRRTSAVYRY